MTDIEFYDLCKKENKILSTIEEKEIASDELAYKALIIVNNMLVDGNGDALLYASSLNVLNTYVKQSKENKKLVGYSFKEKVNVLFKYIKNHPNDYIDAEIQEDNGMKLGIVSIYDIQFSFHNITMTEENQCFKVKDPENPRLPWDNIRKQNCCVTLFDFSYDNSFARTNKMLDGTDFLSAIDSLLDEFHSGTKTISDVVHCIYKKDKQNDSNKNPVRDEKDVDYFNYKYHINIAKYDIASFKEKIIDRTIVPELNEIYHRKTGQYLSHANILSGKYAFQTLLSLLEFAELCPSVGVNVAYSKVPACESFTVFLSSRSDSGEKTTVYIDLPGWTSVVASEGDRIKIVDEFTGLSCTLSDPRGTIRSEILKKYSSNNNEYENLKFMPCMFLFDAQKNDGNSVLSSNKLDESSYSVFFASDMLSFAKLLGTELACGNGLEIAEELEVFMDYMSESSDGTLSNNHQLSVESCIYYIKNYPSSLCVFNYRKANNNTAFFDYITQQFRKANISYDVFSSPDIVNSNVSAEIAIFNDCIPEEDVLDKYNHVIVLCDLYSPLMISCHAMDGLLDYAYEKGVFINRDDFSSVLGFSDSGSGNTFILRSFGLSNTPYRIWKNSNYPISIVRRADEYIEAEGIKKIFIPESISFDCNNKCLQASLEEKEALYQELLDAPNGVGFVIENPVLFCFLEDLLVKYSDYSKWISGHIDDSSKEIIELVKDNAENSAEYNKYMLFAIQYLSKEAWEKFEDSSKDWVVSGISEYYNKRDTDTSLDFSGVALLISKTFEVELCKRISEDYFEYTKKKYGDRYLEELPEALVKQTDDGPKPEDPSKTTLGSFPYIMGLDSKGRIKNQKEYNNFLAFGYDVLLADPDNASVTLPELCDIIYYVRVKFRNTSAHKIPISYDIATDCMEYNITVQRKLGVAMDMFRY